MGNTSQTAAQTAATSEAAAVATEASKASKASKAAEKEAAASEAEKARAENEAAEKQWRGAQLERAADIATLILTETTGGTALALAVGDACWEYCNAVLLRGTPGDTGRFTEAMRDLKKDIAAEMKCDTVPNISRYLATAALARLWDRAALVTIPKSMVQDACTMVTRDDTAPGLTYTEATSAGPVEMCAYQWLNGCETQGPELLQRVAESAGGCKALTLAEFIKARKVFCTSGQGRHNQRGANKGKGKGKGKATGDTAKKAAAKLAAGIKALKDYAQCAALTVPVRIQGLGTVVSHVSALLAELKKEVARPAAELEKATAAAVALIPATCATEATAAQTAATSKGKGRKGKGKAAASEAAAVATSEATAPAGPPVAAVALLTEAAAVSA